MTFTSEMAGQPPGVTRQKIASALLKRLPALTDELLKRAIEQCHSRSGLYGGGMQPCRKKLTRSAS